MPVTLIPDLLVPFATLYLPVGYVLLVSSRSFTFILHGCDSFAFLLPLHTFCLQFTFVYVCTSSAHIYVWILPVAVPFAFCPFQLPLYLLHGSFTFWVVPAFPVWLQFSQFPFAFTPRSRSRVAFHHTFWLVTGSALLRCSFAFCRAFTHTTVQFVVPFTVLVTLPTFPFAFGSRSFARSFCPHLVILLQFCTHFGSFWFSSIFPFSQFHLLVLTLLYSSYSLRSFIYLIYVVVVVVAVHFVVVLQFLFVVVLFQFILFGFIYLQLRSVQFTFVYSSFCSFTCYFTFVYVTFLYLVRLFSSVYLFTFVQFPFLLSFVTFGFGFRVLQFHVWLFCLRLHSSSFCCCCCICCSSFCICILFYFVVVAFGLHILHTHGYPFCSSRSVRSGCSQFPRSVHAFPVTLPLPRLRAFTHFAFVAPRSDYVYVLSSFAFWLIYVCVRSPFVVPVTFYVYLPFILQVRSLYWTFLYSLQFHVYVYVVAFCLFILPFCLYVTGWFVHFAFAHPAFVWLPRSFSVAFTLSLLLPILPGYVPCSVAFVLRARLRVTVPGLHVGCSRLLPLPFAFTRWFLLQFCCPDFVAQFICPFTVTFVAFAPPHLFYLVSFG